MRIILSFFISILSLASVTASDLGDVNTKPKAGLKLKIEGSDGTNGSAVAWDPDYKTYYTIIAGNADYPLEVFDEDGKNLQSTTPLSDMRGLWFNPDYGLIEGNTYDDHDIVSFGTDEDGFIIDDEEPVIEIYELAVDEAQAVLTLNTVDASYAWYDNVNGTIELLDMENGDWLDKINLKLDVDVEKLNYTTVIYTGIEDGEYGLLNFEDKVVYLINEDNGKVSKTIKLPKDAVTNDMFRFSYANGYIWLYDVEEREWTGYSILK